MSSWHSPGSIYNLGHRAVAELLQHPVQVQEKVDGSFFAFGVFLDDQGEPKLSIRSKGSMIYPEAPPGIFAGAVATVRDLYDKGFLIPGYMYRGEALQRPKHNTLHYSRTPKDHIILFDVAVDEESFLDYGALDAQGERLGLEVVPQLWTGEGLSAGQLREFLSRDSVLGGQKIEGVVIKPLVPLFGPDKKRLTAKYVSEHFREVHVGEWQKSNPGGSDILATLGAKYGTPARWDKAVIHLRERGIIQGDRPQDIGPCIKEIPADIWKEEEEAILRDIMKWARPHLDRMFTRGFPEYYKQRLLEQQFEQTEAV